MGHIQRFFVMLVCVAQGVSACGQQKQAAGYVRITPERARALCGVKDAYSENECTVTRAINCQPAATCSGTNPPDFSNDSTILQMVQANCTSLAGVCQDVCSGSIIVQTSCVAPTAVCQALVSGLAAFCPELQDALQANCVILSGLCQGNPFAGVVPFDIGTFVGCSLIPLPSGAATPVLPGIPATNKVLMCDSTIINLEAQKAIIGQLGVTDDLNVIGSGIFGGNLSVDGDIVASGSLDVGGDALVGGMLQVANGISTDGTLCTNGPLVVADTFTQQGPAFLYSTLQVSGSILSNSDLTVGGSVNALSGIVVSGPLCAHDVIADRASIDTICAQQAQVDGLRVVTACIDAASIRGLAVNVLCVQDILIENCLNFDQLAVDEAVIGTLQATDARIDQVCIDTVCVASGSITQLESDQACIDTLYADRLGAQTGCFGNIEVCQLLLEDLFIQNTIQFNGRIRKLKR